MRRGPAPAPPDLPAPSPPRPPPRRPRPGRQDTPRTRPRPRGTGGRARTPDSVRGTLPERAAAATRVPPGSASPQPAPRPHAPGPVRRSLDLGPWSHAHTPQAPRSPGNRWSRQVPGADPVHSLLTLALHPSVHADPEAGASVPGWGQMGPAALGTGVPYRAHEQVLKRACGDGAPVTILNAL